MTNRRAYTLLEVMVALAILALSLTILLGTQATSVRLTERANRMAQAALLARSKMIDIEAELLRDGLPETNEEMDGDFRKEGYDDMTWEALAEVVEITPDAEEAFVNQVYGQLFGGGEGAEEDEGALTGSSAVSAMMPMIVAQVPQFINEVGKRARKVTLTISWKEGKATQTLTVQQYVVDLKTPGAADGTMALPDNLPTLQGGGTPQIPGLAAPGRTGAP